MFDINVWLDIIIKKLQNEFKQRLLFVGLQGSYNRGEATPNSDIDIVVILENLSFEEALLQLENIVRELESGRIKLDDAISSYERAVALKKLCQEKLQAATLKVEKIEISKDGTMSTSPLENVEA